jgi:hypothetical protein
MAEPGSNERPRGAGPAVSSEPTFQSSGLLLGIVDAFFKLMDRVVRFFDRLFPMAGEDLVRVVQLGTSFAQAVQRVMHVLEPRELPGRRQFGGDGGLALLLQSGLNVLDGVVHVLDGLTFVAVEDVFSIIHLLARFTQMFQGGMHVLMPRQPLG